MGYRTAIVEGLNVSQGVDYGKDERLSSLTLSFYREQLRQVHSYPAWDLGFVLKVLLKAPFEPLQMKFVIMRRCHVILEPHASFVAKVELRKLVASILSPVKISALGRIFGPGFRGR